jgi:phosphate-selective porin OprO/OprP
VKKTTLAALLLGATPAVAHADGLKADERGLTFEQGVLTLNLGGRIHVDTAVFDDPATARTDVVDVGIRRARLELSGKVGDVVKFRIDREFAGRSKGWRNLWLGISPVENGEVRGGNMMVPFSTEDLQSSNTIPFTERSLASALAPGYGLGGMAIASGKRWSASVGWFTDGLDSDDGRSVERGRGISGRVTALPLDRGKTRLHLGLAGESRSLRAGEVLRFSADAGSTLAPGAMSSGGVADVHHLGSWNAEAGASFGPLLVQGQMMGLTLARNAAPDLHFNGQTVQASVLVTGGTYDYARGSGTFAGPDLKHSRLGVELAVRYSRLDLSDGAFDRGVGHAVTGGANLYFARNVRLMADFTHTTVRFAVPASDRSSDVGVARLQIAF